MQEQKRSKRREVHAPASSGPDDAATATMSDMVTVTHGPYAESLPVAEMTVGEVRRRFQDRLDIHPEATAFVDGSAADEDAILAAGQLLMFVRRSGEKGGAPWKR